MTTLLEKVISSQLRKSVAAIYADKRFNAEVDTLFKELAAAAPHHRLQILNDKRAQGDLLRLYKTFVSDTDFSYLMEFIVDVEKLLQDMGGHAEEDAPDSEEESESDSEQGSDEGSDEEEGEEAEASLDDYFLRSPVLIENKNEEDRNNALAEINQFYDAHAGQNLPMVTIAGAEWSLGLKPLSRVRFLDNSQKAYQGDGMPSVSDYPWMEARLNPSIKIMAIQMNEPTAEAFVLLDKPISSVNPKLVCALVQIEKMNLVDAISFASECCERCNNLLGYRYSLGWGYPHTSDDAVNCRTKCQCCLQTDAKHYWSYDNMPHNTLDTPPVAPAQALELSPTTIDALQSNTNEKPVEPEMLKTEHSPPNPDNKESIPAQQAGPAVTLDGNQSADVAPSPQPMENSDKNAIPPSGDNNMVDKPKNTDERINQAPPTTPNKPMDTIDDKPPMQRKLT